MNLKPLKITEEYRIDDEEEVKDFIEQLRAEAKQKGYTIKKCGYTKKEKTQKGEVVDSGFHLSVVKEYYKFWE